MSNIRFNYHLRDNYLLYYCYTLDGWNGGLMMICVFFSSSRFGLTFMLAASIGAGFFFAVLVWLDSHTWIYIRKKWVWLVLVLWFWKSHIQLLGCVRSHVWVTGILKSILHLKIVVSCHLLLFTYENKWGLVNGGRVTLNHVMFFGNILLDIF